MSAAIYADLRQQLVSLQRLPDAAVSEGEIAQAYGCSRTPVREAILKLADEGLLEIYPQSGIFVSRIPVAELPEAIVVRRALEGTTTRLAAAQATPSQVLALQAILQRQREADAADDRDAFHRADELFHATIAEIAGYPGIWTLVQQVKVHVDRYRRLTLPQPGRMARAIAEHELIMAAIAAHDPERAVAAIDDHLDGLLADIAATRELNPELFRARRHDRTRTDKSGTAAPTKTSKPRGRRSPRR
ncbi:MAG: GntR family transcriptional regulator [Pseudomonadota bacterium]